MYQDIPIQLQVRQTAVSLGINVKRCHDALYELRRLSLVLFCETRAGQSDIDEWFASQGFGVDEDGFWQSIPLLEAFRKKSAPAEAISYSWHPDLIAIPEVCFRMYSLRNIGPFLAEIRSKLPGTAWIYYQDITNTSIQFPYIDQITAITPDFDWRSYHTFRSVEPESNPDGAIRWTQPTIDYAGEGLIISVSVPVYLQDRFVGLWSIDLPMQSLYRDFVFDVFLEDQVNFLVDSQGHLVAHPSLEAEIDREKGTVFHRTFEDLGVRFADLDPGDLLKQGDGQLFLKGKKGFAGETEDLVAYFEAIPGIDWLFFATFPKQSMTDVINRKIREALDRVKSGDFSYRLENNSEIEQAGLLAEGFNEMAAALQNQEDLRHQAGKEKERLEKKLRHAQKMEAIGTLAGGIAHDFNNILFPIMGYAELLLRDFPEEDPAHEMILNIYQAGTRAKSLVRQILTFSRQGESENQCVSFQSIVKEALELLRASIPTDIEIITSVDPKCGPVLADPAKLHQIIMNLCTNAYHAVESTGGKFEVVLDTVELLPKEGKFQVEMAPGTYARLSVSDNGCGMEAKTRMMIFNPYFTTKEEGKGTGLGLSIVYGIIKELGGEITVYSEPGEGTTFRVLLPIVEESEVSKPEESPASVMGTGRILLVDDEESIARLGRIILERYGYQVTIETDSTQALAVFREDPLSFDLVITDMTMPGLTGEVLAQSMKEIRPDIPVILCTGFSEKLSRIQYQCEAVDHFIMKPITVKELTQAVRQLLNDPSSSNNRKP